MTMKPLKVFLTSLLIMLATYGTLMLATTTTIYFMGGKTVGSTQTGYQYATGDYIISLPTPVTQIQKNDLILTAGAETTVGKIITTTPVDEYYEIRVYTGPNPADINTYTVQTMAQKIIAQIPAVGYIPGLITTHPTHTITLLIVITTISALTYNLIFYKAKPKPTPPPGTNQIRILQELFDEAPHPPSKETIKNYRKQLKETNA